MVAPLGISWNAPPHARDTQNASMVLGNTIVRTTSSYFHHHHTFIIILSLSTLTQPTTSRPPERGGVATHTTVSNRKPYTLRFVVLPCLQCIPLYLHKPTMPACPLLRTCRPLCCASCAIINESCRVLCRRRCWPHYFC